MKTKEFKKAIKDISIENNIDLKVTEDIYDFCIESETRILATVNKSIYCFIDTKYQGFLDMEKKPRQALFETICEFANTPPEERYDEKRYYLKHKFLYKSTETGYINLDIINGYMILADKNEELSTRTKFTQEEIDGMKKAYNTDLKDFEIIEVKE